MKSKRGKVRSKVCPKCGSSLHVTWHTDRKAGVTTRRYACDDKACGHDEPASKMDAKVYTTLAPGDADNLRMFIIAAELAVRANESGDAESLRYSLTEFRLRHHFLGPRLTAKISYQPEPA